MATFSLPPIKDTSPNIPSLSKEELCALPSTSLVALSNNMAVAKSEASMKAAQLKARAKKLTGEASIAVPGKGRNTIETAQSVESVKASMESTIGPVASTTGLMNKAGATGNNILKNPLAAGTTEADAASIASKLSSFNTEII